MEFVILFAIIGVVVGLYLYNLKREKEYKDIMEICQKLCTNKDEKYTFEMLPFGEIKFKPRNKGNNDEKI